MVSGPKPAFFTTAARFRAWLERNHATKSELWVGFHKKATGRMSITWPESVDEALCFGWIDGLRKSLGADSYMIRFTPRRPGSAWSAVNLRKVEELTKSGRMRPAGRAVFEARDPRKSEVYSFERAGVTLTPGYEKRLRAHKKAWKTYQAWPPGHRRTVTHWVMSAKKEDTRLRRLDLLIEHSARGERIPALTPPAARTKKTPKKR